MTPCSFSTWITRFWTTIVCRLILMSISVSKHGTAARNRYWEIFEELRSELGYADYLGALDRYRREDMHDPRILRFVNWLADYPFIDRLYQGALAWISQTRTYQGGEPGRHLHFSGTQDLVCW